MFLNCTLHCMLHPFQRRHSLATNRNQVRCHYTLCDPAQSVCELLAAQVLDLVLLQRPRQLLVQEPEEALLLLTFPSLRAGVCRLGVGTLACKCTDACQWHMTEARSFLGFLVFLLALLLAFVRLRSCQDLQGFCPMGKSASQGRPVRRTCSIAAFAVPIRKCEALGGLATSAVPSEVKDLVEFVLANNNHQSLDPRDFYDKSRSGGARIWVLRLNYL